MWVAGQSIATRGGVSPEEPEPGIFRAASAKYRCEDMDRDGVDAELVNGVDEQILAIKNPELRAACVRAVNDWARELYEEFEWPVHHAFAAAVPDTGRSSLPSCCASPSSGCQPVSFLTGPILRNR